MIHRLLLIILAAFMLCNCSAGDDSTQLPPPAPDFIQVSQITLAGLAEGESETITFDSPAPWTAEIHSSGDWLQADHTHGNAGRAEIRIRPRTDNLGATSRTATLEIYVDGYNAYQIDVEQRPAAASDILVTGNIDNAVMTLRADRTGTVFTDTIYVTSSKAWYLAASEESAGILSFQTDATPQNGVERTIRVVVSAEYADFTTPSLHSTFYIKTNEGTALPITIEAMAVASVYDNARETEGEVEKVSFALTNTQRHGTYTTDLYIESNVRWVIDEKPAWIETSADWGGTENVPSNVSATGNITVGRHHVALRVKPDYINASGYTGTLSIRDSKGQALKTIYLVFAGAGRDYTDYSLTFPATDSEGNPWAFEARRKTTEEGEAYNRKRIAMDFTMTSSMDYDTMEEAPFHLLLVDATNGIAHRQEVHWATLRMGDAALSSTTVSGMYVKQLYLEANERGDQDDKDGLTDPTQTRYAFAYILPRSISFEDLWADEYTLKDEYADNLTLVSQKNDPLAEYTFAFNELDDGATLEIAPGGETRTYTVRAGSYLMLDYVVEAKNAAGEWVQTSFCTIDVNDKVSPIQMSLSFTENKRTKNPFTGAVSGSPREMRIRFNAFIEDGLSKTIYTLYAHQGLMD